ncbi:MULTISPECIES: DUF3099 domain-containing protein [unclassified Microbacterium]|uniref:DUF3099 domain-containing protein n=1 Tax=unclassified Microbacterium TaxID=2609290 RepID=UPI0038654640
MKTPPPQSATSIATAPEDDARARTRKYFIMMTIRVVCFVLMVTVTPYGWYTWVFAAGAAVLPYLAMVAGNVSSAPAAAVAEKPMREIDAPSTEPAAAPVVGDGVFRIQETPPREAP